MANALLFIFLIATVVAAAVFHLSPLAWAPLLVTACGVMFTRMSAREQVLLSERKLFIDLIARRSEWVSALSDNMTQRDKEAHRMMNNLLSKQPMGEPVHLMAIWKAQREARWLFGERMYGLIQLLIDAEAELGTIMLQARTGNHEAAEKLGDCALAMDKRFGDVLSEAAEYLYVGDVVRRRPRVGLLARSYRAAMGRDGRMTQAVPKDVGR